MTENSCTPSGASATSLKTVVDSRRRWSLAARLTAWYTASAFVLIFATTCFLYWAVVNTLEREDDQYLHDKASVILNSLRDQPDNEQELRSEVTRESGPRPAGQIFVRVVNVDGRTVAESPGMNDRLPAAMFPKPFAADANEVHATEVHAANGQSFRALTLRAPKGELVHVAMDRTAEEDLLDSYRWYAAAILAGSVFVCATIGYALARRGLRPLLDITHATRRVRSSTLNERLDVAALPAELAELADRFNEMLGRLEDSFRRLERFSADIAHELRTPVNNLRGEAEVALGHDRSPEHYREVLTSGLEEYGRLSRLIDTLLFLARAESPQTQVTKEKLDIGHELATVREFFEAGAEESGVAVNVQVNDGLWADFDRTQFQQAVGNLVANALANTPRGGSITISAVRTADSVSVEVADTGIGIAPAHLPHVFDRFYRADPSRTSASGSVGLGLALVKSIMTLHGGSCAIESEPDQGTRVRLTFPAGQQLTPTKKAP